MIDNPAAYFSSFGEFHDAYLTGIRWDGGLQIIEVAMDDVRASIDDDDKPAVHGGLIFRGVSTIRGMIDNSNIWISEFSVAPDDGIWVASLILKSGATLDWTFQSVAEVSRP